MAPGARPAANRPSAPICGPTRSPPRRSSAAPRSPFAGIARPEKFYASLEALGAHIAVRRSFPDHHPYRAHEIAALAVEAERRGLALVTTEKDLVRVPAARRAPIVALPVTLAFEDAKGFAALILAAIAKRRARA